MREDQKVAISCLTGIVVLVLLVTWEDVLRIRSKSWRVLASFAVLWVVTVAGSMLLWLVSR